MRAVLLYFFSNKDAIKELKMKAFKIDPEKNIEKDELISNNVAVANNFFSRLFGLIFRRKLRNGNSLLIENCKGIHTFWMMYNIDVIFLDKNNKAISIFCNIRPFKIIPFIKNTSKVLELRSGSVEATSLKAGDLMYFEN